MSTSHRRQSSAQRIAAVAAAVLGLIGALAIATPASAAVGNIDPDAVGSLIVHKFEDPPGPDREPNTGEEVDTTGLVPINGVTFQVQRVDIDLTTSAGWTEVSTLDVAGAQGNLDAAFTALTQVTAGAGQATFSALPVGVYLVTETDPGSNNIAFAAVPFLVTVPWADDGSWNYTVHAYPKNTVLDADKTVDDSEAFILGDTVNWTVTSSVPTVPDGDTITAFGMRDAIDSRLQPDVVGVTVSIGGTVVPTTWYTSLFQNGSLTISFTPTGLAELGSREGQIVEYFIPTVVSSIGDGTIVNEAEIFVALNGEDEEDFPTPPVQTQWGALEVIKNDSENATALLAGAEFQIFLASDTGFANPLELAGETTFVTDDDGSFSIDGLKIGDYVLVETAAPAGYQLPTDPNTPVTITAGSVADAVIATISNTQVPPLQLPLTGGGGILPFLIGGGILVAVSVVLLVFAARRRRQS